MIEAIIDMQVDIEMLKTAFGNSLRVGPIEEIDAKKGFRLKYGDGPNGPWLSPWHPHPESGGATGTWFPLSKGQVVGVINPAGDPRQGVLLRGGFSGVNPPISENLGENKYTFGGVTVTVAGGKMIIDGDVRINGRLHATDGLRGDAGVYSQIGVFPPAPVYISEV